MSNIVKISELTDEEKEKWNKVVKSKKEEQAHSTTLSKATPAQLEANNIPIFSNKDPRLQLRNKKFSEYTAQDYKNAAELNKVTQIKQANKINELAKTNPVQAFGLNALMNLGGGMTQSIFGVNNAINTVGSAVTKRIGQFAEMTGNQELAKSAKQTYDKRIAEGSFMNSTSNVIPGSNQYIDNDIIKTGGKIAGTVGRQLMDAGLGPSFGIQGSTVQGLGVAGTTSQEVLDENPDDIDKAVITGAVKGLAAKKIEDVFDANILTIGGNKSSVQKEVIKLIGNTFKTDVGKKIASHITGVVGENIEEFVEDNIGNIIDLVVNGKSLPEFEEWLNNTGETAKVTTLSTAIMSILGLGGGTYADVVNYQAEQNTNNKINEIRNQLNNDNTLPVAQRIQALNDLNNIGTEKSFNEYLTDNKTILDQLPVANEENRYDNIENVQKTLYNNNESESGINGERYEIQGNKGILGQYGTNIQQKEESQQISKHTRTEYSQWEQSIKPTTYSKLTSEQKQVKDNIKRQYGKDIVFFDENNTNYYGGASLINPNNIYISTNEANEFGLNRIALHETLESNIAHNKALKEDIIIPTIETIIEDSEFQNQKNKFWEGQEGEIPSDYAIAKDIICDRFSELKSGESLDYENVLSKETNMTIDYAIENFENQLKAVRVPTALKQVAPSVENNALYTGEYTKQNEINQDNIEINSDLPISENQKFRKHYKSIMQSPYTTDEARAISKKLMKSDTYVPESNNKQLERADKRIELAGADSELNSLMSRSMTGGNIKADDIAVGERLIQYYSKTGNKEKLQEAIQATAMAGTTAGQTVQAMSLLNHQTPEGQAVWLQRSVEKMNNDLIKTRGENSDQFNLTPEMTEKIVSSKNSEELQNNLNEVYKELGQQVSKTTIQKIDAWRYFAMLANPRTHIRNIIGNVAMTGTQSVKNKIAGTIEGIVSKVKPEIERTHTINPASEEVKSFAKSDIKNVADRLGLNENKYNPKNRLENNMRTFKRDTIENTIGKAFKFNDNLLEAEDGVGLKHGYIKALSEYMTANNLTPENITDKQLAKARNYAVEQAKEATFHQESSLATLLNQFSNKNNISKFFMDSTLPFKKTPVNVAKAGLEYSPVGLVKSAVYDTVKLRKGNITINQYIDNVSKGLTGTGISLVGYALASAGILKASGSDDKDKEGYDKDRGNQTYSIKIGDNTYSLDWLAPTGIPLFIGAEIHEIMQSSKEEKSSSSDDDTMYSQAIKTATNILDAFTNAMNPMTEMSMLSGLTSSLKSYDGDSSKMLANMGTNAVKSYVNQFVPTALSQVAKTTDEYERNTTSTKTGTLPRAVDSTKNYIMSKIPGLRQMLPTKTDTWGNDVKQSDNILRRSLENGVFPWTRKEVSTNAVDNEIMKVYDNTGESSVFPNTINKNLTINKQKYLMTSDEYSKYKKQYGKDSYELLDNLVKSSDYKKMTDEQKKTAIEKVYSYANEQIKLDYAKQNKLSFDESTLSETINQIKKVNGNTSNYFEYLALTKDLDENIEKMKVLYKANFDSNTKEAIYKNSIGKDDSVYQLIEDTNINITEYIGYKAQKFVSDKKDDGTMKGSSISGSQKKKVYNYIENMNITYSQKLLLKGIQYSLTDSEKNKLANYVRSLNTSNSNKLEIYSKLKGFTVYKDGTFDY